ncbi:MAG: SAM-dependent methyltransferase [Bacteroides sp. SM23_62_1]|nr:MAG: SAM-dependent methyltransferase [Bacteroides sp. SM23_62_1]
MAEKIRIILKSGKDQSIRRFHPWVFSGAIKKIHGFPSEGDLVEVYSNKDEFLGAGHYANGSIAVRIISFKPVDNVHKTIQQNISAAYKCREEIGLTDHPEINVFRMVNGEGDGLPGLIIDYYNGTVVTQFHSTGLFREIDGVVESLKNIVGKKLTGVYNKSSSTLTGLEGTRILDGYLLESAGDKEVIEYGNTFIIDWEDGQKTGFYIDQRENRKLLGTMSAGRSVLNLFGYTGGFSVYALRGGAKVVHTVDSSSRAIEHANQNVQKNIGHNAEHKTFVEDVSSFLQNTTDKYDLIIADPPAFAKHQHVLANALQGYKRLNTRIFEIINPGGIVYTFSCSQVVSRENFRKSVFAAAANAGRKVRILYQLSQPPDHPVSIYHPEGEYLKGLVLYVE